MFKVLIVEDEILVRKGLMTLVQWDKFDMSICDDAGNGQLALKAYEKHKPDIIITDLKMPVMNGMDLIEKIRSKDKKTKIVILTCLDEFELARKAMLLGVSDFIPKLTMKSDDLEKILKKIQLELIKSEKSEPQKLPISIDMVKEKLLKEFMLYNIYNVDEFDTHIKLLKLRLNQKRLVLCIMEIPSFTILQEQFTDDNGQLIKVSMLNILNEILSNCHRGEAFYDDPTHYIILLSFDDISSELNIIHELSGILKTMQSTLCNIIKTKVSFGISNIRNGYGALKDMYKEACNILKFYFFIGSDLLFASKQDELRVETNRKIEALRKMPVLIESMDNKIEEKYSSRIDKLQEMEYLSKEKVQVLFIQMVYWTAVTLNFRETDLNIALYCNKVYQCETLDGLVDIYKNVVVDFKKKNATGRTLHHEISKALLYIKNNYKNNIDLNQVAAHIGFSSSYLSSLFKKELNVNFTEYLNQFRVEKAKLLLLETSLKSYEIAQKVGFSEYTYFSKVFKKLTNTNPYEFRKLCDKEYEEDTTNEEI